MSIPQSRDRAGEDPALELLRGVRSVASLSVEAKQRIARNLDRPLPGPRPLPRILLVSALAACLLVFVRLRSPTETAKLSVPAAPVTVRDGRLQVKARQEQHVAMPDANVTVAPGSLVEVEVGQRRATRVAVYEGRATMEAARPAVVEAPQSIVVEPGPALDETGRIAEAIDLLRQRKDARGALRVLDEVADSGPSGRFAAEVERLRVEALMQLGDRSAALRRLDELAIEGWPRSDALFVLRGDLRAEQARWEDAVLDYTRVQDGATASLVERALVGKARCEERLGRAEAARADLREYLRRFPKGRFVDEARRELGE